MKLDVLALRPLQFVLGMREVDDKVAKIKSLGTKELKDWMDDHTVPAVIGPGGTYHLIDHHHFVAACYHARIDKVPVDVVADKHKTTREEFWSYIHEMKWTYLYDQFGNGPHKPWHLPFDVRCMADDPFRSLAWELRQAGVIEKIQKPFSEFFWAQRLRKVMTVDQHFETWDEIVKKAIHAAKTF